jgi:hypothetical protein
MTDTIDALRSFYERRHPAYADNLAHWHFLEQAYRGGRQWFATNIFKYFKEGEQEFTKRLERAYRFNHTREVVELVQKYLFKAEVTRSAEAPEVVSAFWKSATLNGLDINQLMRQVSVGNSIGGRVAVVVDNNFPRGLNADGTERVLSVEDIDGSPGKIYAYLVPTKDILDYAFDEDGNGGLIWVQLREYVRDDTDYLNSTGIVTPRMRVWTRTGWKLYEEQETGNRVWDRVTRRRVAEKKVILVDEGTHDLNRVPVILADHTIGTDPYIVPGLIDDIAYLDRAIANYLSNLDAIIQDQTFSQLAIPAQSLQQGDDIYTKVLELGTKRVFVYDGGAGSTAKPEYLSPDPKQAQIILEVIAKIINEIYHTIGLAGERTKQDNSVGIDNSSGVAKAYDFERVNSLLLSKAQACQTTENKIVDLVLAWAGDEPTKDALVTYPVTFDVMRLVDDLTTAEALGKIAAPIALRRQHMKGMIDKLFPQLKKDLRKAIEADVEKWLEGTDELPVRGATPRPPAAGAKPTASPSRQGSVTKDTPAS